jgi:DNA-binding GntR family transcriptional regulator
MELVDVDVRHAYETIREAIVTLELAPGSLVDEQRIAGDMDLGARPVREALKLLAHDELVFVTARHGIYVAEMTLPDLDRICEVRLEMEPLCAALAACRAERDDLAVLEALRREQEKAAAGDSRRLLDMDHKFHRAIVRAAKNKHLVRIMEHLFGLSQRLWFMALPRIDVLRTAVAQHLELAESIERRDAERARNLMRDHVREFHEQVRTIFK